MKTKAKSKTQQNTLYTGILEIFSLFFRSLCVNSPSSLIYIYIFFYCRRRRCRRIYGFNFLNGIFFRRGLYGWIELITHNTYQLTVIFIYCNIFPYTFFSNRVSSRYRFGFWRLKSIFMQFTTKRNFSWPCYCSSQYTPQCKLREYCKWLWHDEPTKWALHRCHQNAPTTSRQIAIWTSCWMF